MQTHATYSITNYLQKECLSSLKSLDICKVNLKLEHIMSRRLLDHPISLNVLTLEELTVSGESDVG